VAACQKVLGVDDPQMLKRIGMGAIFHDVGKSQISPDILDKDPVRHTREEAHAVRMHPAVGLELVEEQGDLSPTSASIIRWHHESMDGTGYPDGLQGERIGKIVRLATIADTYDRLTTGRAYEPARSPFEALQTMVSDMGGKLDEALLKMFVQFLGPTKGAVTVRSRTSDVAARLRGS
jgi:HD-GYP domain-containing protein (c-di-GMP phosphodiesterase class II)